ncbi:hypothetical protein ACOMHN_027484 [Nucella lapillus]
MDHSGHGSNMDTTTMMMMGNNSMGGHAGHHGNMSMSMQDPHAGHAGHGGTTMGGEHSGHGASGHSAAGHTMQMFFHTGVTEYILFEALLTSDVGGLVGACVVMFVLSVAYEGLKYFREFLMRRSAAAARQEVYSTSNGNGTVLTKQPEVGARMLSGGHFLQTVLHMVQVFLSYCLMLVFMTYNVYLCLAIIIGAGLGYFLFGWRRAMVVDMNEHCH